MNNPLAIEALDTPHNVVGIGEELHGLFTIQPHIMPHFGVGRSRGALTIEDD